MDAPPPTYEAATASKPSTTGGASTSANPPSSSTTTAPSHKTRNGIPIQSRRSMEDERRELPTGWIRQFDAQSNHQFFVDTTVDPPRSIWHHPYDDETYMNSLPAEERARIHGVHGLLSVPSHEDMMAESTDEEHEHGHEHEQIPTELPPRPEQAPKGLHKLGRRVKDKVTGTTHEQREVERKQRAEAERETYARHQFYRAAMARAEETGEPQFLGKDKSGKDVYIEPSVGYGGAYGTGAYGYNPYAQGPYTNPNARFIRPADPYYRPYGYGYGGGLGYPLLGYGLGGGLLLGGLTTAALW